MVSGSCHGPSDVTGGLVKKCKEKGGWKVTGLSSVLLIAVLNIVSEGNRTDPR